MHRVYVNNEKNRLYFYLSGNIDRRESKGILDSTIRSLEELKPGFDIISDISGYTPISSSADITISSLFRTIKEHGIRKAVRVTPNADSINYTTKNLIEEFGINKCQNAGTIEEAEMILG